MRYGSVCSGVEAATLAWEPLGWEPLFFSEVASYPSRVLERKWPSVPNLGDMTKIDGAAWRGKIDVLIGGTPCQAFSLAGTRKSLSDARGNLSLSYVELANAADPNFIVWENVPGCLATDDNAFGCLLAGLAGEHAPLEPAGEGWTDAGFVLGPRRAVAWRCLDAQYFGVAQRRKRVFLVAVPRAIGYDPRAVLFESEMSRRDSPKTGVLPGGGGSGTSGDTPKVGAFIQASERAGSCAYSERTAPTLLTCLQNTYVMAEGRVRRMTPKEAERLQGMPDDHTFIEGTSPYERFRAVGNSMAVPCVRWIGERIGREVETGLKLLSEECQISYFQYEDCWSGFN